MADRDRLYELSVAAARRYFTQYPKPKSELAKAFFRKDFEMFRIGWMIGRRAKQK